MEKVVCKARGLNWNNVRTGTINLGKHPEKNEICTVVGTFKDSGLLFLKLEGYDPDKKGYDARDFVPISDSSPEELMEELETKRELSFAI